MIDELEEKRQKRRETHAGMVRWVKSLREKIPSESRAVLASESVGADIRGATHRILFACTDEDIVDMLCLCTGAHLHGELAEHIRSVRFVETEAERVAREASPFATAYAKLSDMDTAWLWGALSNVQYRAPREGHPAAERVMDELFALIRSRGRK